MAAEDLRLKVSAAEYMERIAQLDNKVQQMGGILAEYETLQRDSVRVLGDSDSNYDEMQHTVQQNIQSVKGQMQLLKESRQMLQNQMDKLEELSGNVTNLFDNTRNLAKTAFKTVKIVGDLVD